MRNKRRGAEEKVRKYKAPDLATEFHRISQKNTERFCENLCQSVANKNPIFLCDLRASAVGKGWDNE